MKEILKTKIPKALEAWKQVGFRPEEELPKEYKGYIASFGASLVNAGLIPTLIYFENESSNKQKSEASRVKIINALHYMHYGKTRDEKISFAKKCLDKNISIKAVTQNAIALKIALRTYKFKN